MNKIKRSHIICLLCALLLTITVMSQNLAQAASLTITPGVRKYYTAAAGGETITVTLSGAYTSVELKGKPSWVTSKKSGNKYTLTVLAIPKGTQTRQGDVVWVYGSKTYTLRITQNCAHTYAWETTTAATCCKSGVQRYRCTKCKKLGSGTNSRTIPPTGKHSWGAWQVQKAATCTTDGVKIRYCKNGPASQTEKIPASHKYTTGSNNERRCSVCNLPDYDYYMNSSTHWVSNSCHDERGKGYSSGGKVGDNNGDEWKMDTSFGTINVNTSTNTNITISVYRYTSNSNVGNKLARLSIEAALNNNIGYDQSQNYTYKDELSKVEVGWDPKAVKTKCSQDCAAGVSANVIAVGHQLNIKGLYDMPLSCTADLGAALENAGFKKLKLSSTTHLSDNDIKSLRAGDILVVRYKNSDGKWKGHALVNVTN